jgi:hypothetical protein
MELAGLGAILSVAGTVAGFAGSIANANAMKAQAEAVQQQATYKAKIDQIQGQQQAASAQRQQQNQLLKTKYAQSRLQALAAGSGGGADDPTVIKLGQDIAGQGEYNALSALYQGQSSQWAWNTQAGLDVYQGNLQAMTLNNQANSTILGGIGGLATGLGRTFA